MANDLFARIIRRLSAADDPRCSQCQREALLDLLVWTMFVDRHVAAPEQAHIKKEAAGLAWEGRLPVDRYVDASVRRIRDVLGSPDAERAYLEDINIRLGDEPTRVRAVYACQELTEADGQVAPAEATWMELLKKTLLQP